MRFFTIFFEFTKETSFANENEIYFSHTHRNHVSTCTQKSKPILYMKEIKKKCSQINNF